MVCPVLLGVIPILAKEPPQSRALKAWLDIWLPLLLALPIAAAPLLDGASRIAAPLMLGLIDLIPVSVAVLIAGAALIDRRCAPARCIDGSHVLALLALGTLLALASITGRMMDWAGHLLLTASMLWLWTVSGDPGSTAGRDSAEADPVFLVDWAGPLKHPVGAFTQSLLLLGPLLLLGAIFAPFLLGAGSGSSARGNASVSLLAYLVCVPLVQCVVLVGVWARVGPTAAVRCAVSTIILTVMFGIGVLCARLIPWLALVAGLRHGVDTSYEVTDLTGLTALLLPALLILALAGLGLTQACQRRTLRAMGWGFVAASVTAMSVSLALARSSWPTPADPEESASPEQTTPSGGEDSAPQSNTGSFLQESSI